MSADENNVAYSQEKLRAFELLITKYYDQYIECVVAANYQLLAMERVRPTGRRFIPTFIDENPFFSDNKINEIIQKYRKALPDRVDNEVMVELQNEFPLPFKDSKFTLQERLDNSLRNACVTHNGNNVFEYTDWHEEKEFSFPTADEEFKENIQEKIEDFFCYADNIHYKIYKDYTEDEQEDRGEVFEDRAFFFGGRAELIYQVMVSMIDRLNETAFPPPCQRCDLPDMVCDACFEKEDHWFSYLV